MIQLFVWTLSLWAIPAGHAQGSPQSLWLNVDYSYTDFTYKEPSVTETGRLAGVDGEAGFSLGNTVGLVAQGSYLDGNLSFNGETLTGTSTQSINTDYMRDLRGLLQLSYGQSWIAGGLGQSEWYDHLPTAYRRRETFNYFPVTMLIRNGSVYLRGEWDFWRNGTASYNLSDLGTGLQPLSLAQKSGYGYGGELGLTTITALHIEAHMFVAYHHWSIASSLGGLDGGTTYVAPKMSFDIVSGGIGIGF